ncbi:MAG: hypothetical protein E7Z80_03820 [Methanobrevibacter thaueri]|nr:hypothetical protein [Methanobrevibacter thaueri]
MELTKNTTPEEFKNHYFLKTELVEFLRKEGLKTTGNKQDLEKRIIHYLKTGKQLKEPEKTKKPIQNNTKIALNAKLGENFKCSEDKREFFQKHIGKGFKFKVKFQKWLKSNPDKTYQDAIQAYHTIQNTKETTKIPKQFQYNQYIRDFFKNNPDKTLNDAIKCWKHKKNQKGHNKYEKTDLQALKG